MKAKKKMRSKRKHAKKYEPKKSLGANKYVMKIGRVSTHSYCMILPKEVIKKFKWKERQKLVILVNENKQELKIRDWKKNK